VAKSTAEQLRELYEQLAVLTERDATRQREVEELKAVVEREREAASRPSLRTPRSARRTRFCGSWYRTTSPSTRSGTAGGGP